LWSELSRPAMRFFQSSVDESDNGNAVINDKDNNSQFLWLLIIPAAFIPALIIGVVVCVVAKKKAAEEAKYASSMQQAIAGGSTGTMQLNEFAPTLSAMGETDVA
jgi:hypothetical protein